MNGFNADYLIQADHYTDTMRDAVIPYVNARRRDMTVPGWRDAPLFASRFDADAPRGTVLMVHGFTENAEKLLELIHSLLRNGMSVVAYDQRGHGRSWRAPELDGPSLTHVDRFQDYVQDLDAVYTQAMADMPKPHRVFCHSMGGAVTALYLETHPGRLDRAAMCAPMIAPNLGSLPKTAVRVLCGVARLLGQSRRRVFVSRPYAGPEAFEPSCATGRARFDWYEALRAANPEFQNNGPTYSWLRESANVTDAILAPGAPERIDATVRLYTAEMDTMVLPEPQQAFIARVKGGERMLVKGAKHEIYRSDDNVLFPWWHDVLAFLMG